MSEIDITLTDETDEISVDVVSGGSMMPVYDGLYDITPSTAVQNFETRNKTMTRNLKVYAIRSKGSVEGLLQLPNDIFEVTEGYYNFIRARIDPNAIVDLKPENIRKGKTILGVTGTYEG